MRGEDRDPILGLMPRRVLTTARGRRKGLSGSATFDTVRPGGAAAARSATVLFDWKNEVGILFTGLNPVKS
ncbi:hypothetical protein NDU88_003963 [Pleurodeles waltl]|uniref:Uncharacterized protein n=1 Tax=Pleurodeles waltl TaxID=8319 RepID=A0AAV7SHF0_PLEWA|nr:hypothetical protein NDU88_003963 [Pleurodeles waltl]